MSTSSAPIACDFLIRNAYIVTVDAQRRVLERGAIAIADRLIVEVGEDQAVTWTKPDDLPFDPDPKQPLPKLGGLFGDGFHAAFCDGSVRFLRHDIGEQTLRALITRDGGEAIRGDF